MNKCKTPIIDVKDYKDLGILPLLRKSLPSLIIFSKLGEGAYGAVYDVIYENKHAALKIETSASTSSLWQWASEFYCHKKAYNENITTGIYFFKIFAKNKKLYKITISERVETVFSSLLEEMFLGDDFDSSAIDYIDSILNFIKIMHSIGVAHCDIKSDNVGVVLENGVLRYTLIDFGIAEKITITNPNHFFLDYLTFYKNILYIAHNYMLTVDIVGYYLNKVQEEARNNKFSQTYITKKIHEMEAYDNEENYFKFYEGCNAFWEIISIDIFKNRKSSYDLDLLPFFKMFAKNEYKNFTDITDILMKAYMGAI